MEVTKGTDSEFNNVVLNSSESTFLGKSIPETSKSFVYNETTCTSVFKGADSEHGNYFLRFGPKIHFFDRFGPEASKCVVLNETRSIGVLKGFDPEFGNCFFKFLPLNTFLEHM